MVPKVSLQDFFTYFGRPTAKNYESVFLTIVWLFPISVLLTNVNYEVKRNLVRLEKLLVTPIPIFTFIIFTKFDIDNYR